MTTKTWEEAQREKLIAFVNGETDDFDLWARDPAKTAPIAAQIAEGFTIESAGGACPFQAEGQIMALAADDSAVQDTDASGRPVVPMRWYYRSRGGWVSLNVAMTQDECYGSNPLFSAGESEPREFNYSGWPEHLRSLIPQLTPVKHLHYFPTFNVDEKGWVSAVQLVPGMGVRELLAAHHAGDPRVVGVNLHKLVTNLTGRGNTVEEAAADARTFRFSEYLAGHGLDEDWQRRHHGALIEHMDPRPFNPWLNKDDLDIRARPTVELAAQPFRIVPLS